MHSKFDKNPNPNPKINTYFIKFTYFPGLDISWSVRLVLGSIVMELMVFNALSWLLFHFFEVIA